MTQDDRRWRDKYRDAVTQQEQLEKALAAQQALLHRTVLALSLAAEGQDGDIDERLSAIRVSLKNNDVAGFDRMVKSLRRVTETADKKRREHWHGISQKLSMLADTLAKSGLSANLKPAIKHYKKSIPSGELLPATLHRLLEELIAIQAQGVHSQTLDKPGLLQRFFASKEDDTKEIPEAPPTLAPITDVDDEEEEIAGDDTEEHHVIAMEGELLADSEDSHDVTDHEPDKQTSAKYRQRHIPEAVHDRPVYEPAFSRISDRITIILTELLAHFPTASCIEQKTTKIQARINRGLNWYELVPTLEDIRDFIIQSSLETDDNHRLYLSNVYGDLNHIIHALGQAIELEAQQQSDRSRLFHQVDDGVKTIGQALRQHEDIDQLKAAVRSQIEAIQAAVHQQKESEQGSLASQLDAMVKQVKTMEAQDNHMREQLKQEKIRATTDSLTGLPNREAYSKKVHEEMLRWQRYQHPLCLAILDVDFFKKINDTHGHRTGDKVLQVISSSISKRLREVDFIARFGGEEFVILLPETPIDDALAMLNRIRERFSKIQMRKEETRFSVTVSIGIAQFNQGDGVEDVFERADKALYSAKENGRNQCVKVIS